MLLVVVIVVAAIATITFFAPSYFKTVPLRIPPMNHLPPLEVHQSPEGQGVRGLNISAAIWERCREIEGPLWEVLGCNDSAPSQAVKLLVVVDGNTSWYANALKELGEGVYVKVHNRGELGAIEEPLQYVLAYYGLPDELPVVVAVGPPVYYVCTGTHCPMPDPLMLELLRRYHPANFFSSGEAIAFVVHNSSLINDTTRTAEKLDSSGKNVAVYYNVGSYGFASAGILEEILDEFVDIEDYVILAKDGKIEEIIPLEEAIERFNSVRIPTQPEGNANVTVYFIYSPSCPHCESVLPFVEELAANCSWARFVFCDATSPTDECRAVIEDHNVEFVPTAVIKARNETRILVGEDEVRTLDAYVMSIRENPSLEDEAGV